MPLTLPALDFMFCSNDYWLGHDDCESCDKDCFPDVLSPRLSEWISYPIALAQGGGLRELELSFFVRMPCQCELPPSLFSCQSLNVLKLASNLEIDNARIPMINLPNLKLLHLDYVVFNDDDFVTRLVSSCPILEDLSLDQCLWKIWNCLSISSPCLRRLSLYFLKAGNNRWKSIDLLLIDTPNLQCLHYGDNNVATNYSIAPMNALVKASIYLHGVHVSFETELKLVTALSHVQELSLRFFDQISYFSGDLWDRLPVFRNLRTLKLGGYYNNKWDTLLPLILHRTPSLETLVFLEGAFWATDKIAYIDGGLRSVRVAALEAESWRTADAIPSCCFTHLKRIVFKLCFSNERELNAIKFLLAKSSILEELVLRLSNTPPKLDQFEIIVEGLPRASNSCLITMQR